MKSLLLLLWSFALLSPLMAAVYEPLPDQAEIERRIALDPAAAYASIEKLYLALNEESDEVRRIHLSNFLMLAAAQIDKTDIVARDLENIKAAWRRAGELNLIDDRLSLGMSLAMMLQLFQKDDEWETISKDTIVAARQFRDSTFLMQALANYGQILSRSGRLPEALPWLHEAQVMANDPKLGIEPLARHLVRASTVLALDSDDFKSVFDLFEDSLRYFREQGMLSYVAIFSFNAALSIKRQKNVDFARVSKLFGMARESARDIHDSSTEGASLAELAGIDVESGHPEEGLRKAKEAIRVIGSSDDRWLGRAYGEKARAELALGFYATAMEDVERALNMISVEMVEQKAVLLHRKAAILEKLQRFPGALAAEREAREVEQKVARGRDSENFTKLRVQLGLQMEEQKNVILQKENELQAARIEASRRLVQAFWGICSLLLLALGFMLWALYNARRIAKANVRIRTILDIIEEGILTIDSDLALEPFHSPYLQKLYPNLSGNPGDAIDLLLPASAVGAELHSMVRECLRNILGEELITWELNKVHLPDEIRLGSEPARYIHILWQPVLGADEKIHAVLVSLRDVTETRERERELADQIETARSNQERTQELYLTSVVEVRRLLERLEALQSKVESSPVLLRQLHTAKGEARTLGLKHLSGCIHQLESLLQSGATFDWRTLREEMQAYRDLLKETFTEGMPQHAQSLTEVLGGLLPGLKNQLQAARISLGSLAIVEQVNQWPPSILDETRQCLLHGLANCADHGYIIPDQPGPASFHVEALEDEDGFTVILRDFGAGLNREALTKLAKARGFVPSDADSWADVVFLDGISTSVRTTETSGRGVGLAAVRASCRDRGGDAHLLPNDLGSGSRLVMQWARPEKCHPQPSRIA